MKGLLKSPYENLCSNAQITQYFATTSKRNNPALWWHIILLVKLVIIATLDFMFFRRFQQKLGVVETPSQREEKILAQYEAFNLSDGLTQHRLSKNTRISSRPTQIVGLRESTQMPLRGPPTNTASREFLTSDSLQSSQQDSLGELGRDEQSTAQKGVLNLEAQDTKLDQIHHVHSSGQEATFLPSEDTNQTEQAQQNIPEAGLSEIQQDEQHDHPQVEKKQDDSEEEEKSSN